jgi:hypothetical protein
VKKFGHAAEVTRELESVVPTMQYRGFGAMRKPLIGKRRAAYFFFSESE